MSRYRGPHDTPRHMEHTLSPVAGDFPVAIRVWGS